MADPATDPDTGTGTAPINDAVVPPWLWLTLCTLILGALLFVSFRRKKSAELYTRARDAIRDRFARCWPFGRRGRLQLSDAEAEFGNSRLSRQATRPRSASQASSDQSSLSSSSGQSPFSTPRADDDDDDQDDDDISPFPRTSSSSAPFRTRRDYTLDTTPLRPLVSSVLSALGWTASRATNAFAGQGEKRDGIARMFWGVRASEQTGGIRLGSGGESPVGQRRSTTAAATPGMWDSNQSPNATSGARLFRLNDDELATDGAAGEDAVELPARFSLDKAPPPPPRT